MVRLLTVGALAIVPLVVGCSSDESSCRASSSTFPAGQPPVVAVTVEGAKIGTQDLGGSLWVYRDLVPAWAPVSGTIDGIATVANGTMQVDAGDGHVIVLHSIACY